MKHPNPIRALLGVALLPLPYCGGTPRHASVEGARPGVFHARTGLWTPTGPPNTDAKPSLGMIAEATATGLLWIPVGTAIALAHAGH